MTAEDMAKECIEVNVKEYTDPLNRSGKKVYLRYYTNCFNALLKEIQSDERCLLYFVGRHFQSTSSIINSGNYVYILTNRRIIMAGAFSNMGTMLIPFNAFKMSLKNFPCAKKPLYLNELQDVIEGMSRSRDRLGKR